MKCIKAIRKTDKVQVGTIKRVNDSEAESRVSSGYWKYVPKSEWKAAKSPSKEEAQA